MTYPLVTEALRLIAGHEAEADKLMARIDGLAVGHPLRTRLLARVAQLRDWIDQLALSAPTCPDCGARIAQAHGRGCRGRFDDYEL